MSSPRSAATSSALIATRGLSKRYGDRDALIDVTVEFHEGRCCGVFGSNGSGKTTLLKILSSLIVPSGGEAEVAGYALPQRAEQVRAAISLLLDAPLLPRDFTLREGLRYYADLHQVEASSDRIEEIAERVGLSWRLRDPIRTFSRGMGQRASLACCLLADRPILILDEPFTGLDQSGSGLVEDVIEEFKSRGRTVVLVTHELERGVRLSDSALVLSRGRVALDGAPGEWNREDLLEAMA